MRHPLVLAAGAALLAACTVVDPDAPAGSHAIGPTFGVATRANQAVHSGEVTALSHLGTRFADTVPTTLTFAFNSAALDATARSVLDQQAGFMQQFPEVRFSVFGHTDLVGSNGYNLALGRRRAEAAVRYLAARGVSPTRLEALVSEGESQPVVPVPGPERANRRTVTRVSGFLQEHPMVLDGKYAQIVYRRYVASSGQPATGSGGATSTAGASAPAGG
ncbi:OmpA family protein [Jannaschia sp. LMIT008]|uniref:OmpA family protein n=1 Tax=Jannaschia maritima TaxID=3032585 RepID=UPI0028117712|nr:OmpA family protein [Jannaschia sp. LMIT008]